MIHDWTVLIMWVTSLLVTLWGQHWYDKAKRQQDAIQYMIEEQADGGTDSDSGDGDPTDEAGSQDPGVDQP